MHLRTRFIGRDSAAFTLIELLVVIAIIAVLASFLLPVFGRTKQQADIVKTLSNMKQMGAAILLFANDNNQMLPGRVADGNTDPNHLKWPTLLAPYVGNVQVYWSPIPTAAGRPSYKVTDPTQLTRSDQNYTSYIYNGLNDVGALADSSVTVRLNTIDSPSQTILLGIPYPQTGFYMDFSNRDNDNDLNKTAFPAGSIYVLCDGSSTSCSTIPTPCKRPRLLIRKRMRTGSGSSTNRIPTSFSETP